MKPTTTALLAAAAAALTLAPLGLAEARSLTRDLSVEQRPLADWRPARPSPSGLTVRAWLDGGKESYRIGETVTVFVRPNRDAYITLLDVGTSGKVHIIFPNRYQRNNFVPAHAVLRVPPEGARFRIRVGGPVGRELIKVIATRDSTPLIAEEWLDDAGPYKAVRKSARVLTRDLAIEFDREGKDFAVTNMAFEIIERDAALDEEDEEDEADEEGRPRRRRTAAWSGDVGAGAPISAGALFRKGERAFYGEGLRGGPDIRAALGWYRKAAEKGHGLAMVRIGEIFEKGMDVDRDPMRAERWYRKAAALGNTQAMVRLAVLYGRGIGVRRNPVEALAWLNRAAKAGDGAAHVNLARMYDRGEGLSADPEAAARHLLAAIRAGAWSAQEDVPHLSAATRRAVQRLLREAGYYRGAIDGKIGPETRAALADYGMAG